MEKNMENENKFANMFMGLENSTHLAACSQSPMLKRVWRSLEKYREDIMEYGNPWELWSEKVDQMRSLVARLIGANQDEIAITFSVSSALSGLLSGFGESGKKRIVTDDLEYPTTNYIILAQGKNGWKHETIRHNHGIISIDQYGGAIDSETELATVAHVSSMNGFRQDLKSIAEICHGKGVNMYVDCYQSLGTIPIDVKRTGIDYMAGGMLKWLLGSSGIAFLYVRKDLAEEMEPSSTGWFSQSDPFKFGAEELHFAEGARRFESGTWSIPSLYASIEGIRTIMETGTEFINERIERLAGFALDMASDMGFQSPTPADKNMRGGIVAIDIDHPFEVENKLRKDHRIFTSARGNFLRISPHFYNTKDDIIKFFESLKTIKHGR